MYYSSSGTLLDKIVAILQISGMAFFAVIGFLATIFDAFDSIASSENISFSFGIFIGAVLIMAQGFYKLYMIGNARKFNNLFKGDYDGMIEISKIAVLHGGSERKCIQQIDKLIQKGYLVNCHLQNSPTPSVCLHERESKETYLGTGKSLFILLLSLFFGGWAEFFLFFTVCAFAGAIGGEADYVDAFPIWLGLGALNAIILYITIRARRKTERARRFNSLFINDRDGSIALADSAAVLGLEISELARDFDTLLRQGYLCKCHLEANPEPRIVLNNGGRTTADRFTTVICPHCGATNTFPAGFVGKCAYCDSEMQV